MRKIVLYIAVSLDGYIADEHGSVDWIAGDGTEPDNFGTFPEFIETVDTVILGYKTYHQIVTELSPNQWAYPGKKTYVLTHKSCESTEEIIFTNKNIVELLSDLQKQDGKSIWICGGANIINQLMKPDMIDVYTLTIVPTLIGKGIRLFDEFDKEKKLTLLSTKQCNGMIDLTYVKR